MVAVGGRAFMSCTCSGRTRHLAVRCGGPAAARSRRVHSRVTKSRGRLCAAPAPQPAKRKVVTLSAPRRTSCCAM